LPPVTDPIRLEPLHGADMLSHNENPTAVLLYSLLQLI
jgi:hypothetical protein